MKKAGNSVVMVMFSLSGYIMATAEFQIEDHGIHEVQKMVESFVTVKGFSLVSVYVCG